MDAKERIKYFMTEKNISEYKLAKLSGLSQSTISNIFVRNTSPTVTTLEAICKGLGITMAQFFTSEKENYVYLNDEQVELFEKWKFLNSKEKSIINTLIDAFSENNKL